MDAFVGPIRKFIDEVGLPLALEIVGFTFLYKAYFSFDFGVAEIGVLLVVSGATFELLKYAVRYIWREGAPEEPWGPKKK